jgi:hypothetical protein
MCNNERAAQFIGLKAEAEELMFLDLVQWKKGDTSYLWP